MAVILEEDINHLLLANKQFRYWKILIGEIIHIKSVKQYLFSLTNGLNNNDIPLSL